MVPGPESKQETTDKSPSIAEVNKEAQKANVNAVGQALDAKVATEQNKELVDKSKTIVESMAQKPYFNNIVNLLAFFGESKTGTTIKITNAPNLVQNGRENIGSGSIIDTNETQKAEIVQAFMAIPENVLRVQVMEFNKKNKLGAIPTESLQTLIHASKQYQEGQNKIQQNDAIIKKYADKTGEANKKPTQSNGNVDLASYEETEIIGELFELPKEEQIKITKSMDGIKNTYTTYKISSINLLGRADATHVSDNGEKKVTEFFNKHLQLLQQKGFDTSEMPANYADLGSWLVQQGKIKPEQTTDNKLVANRAFGMTRALMQLSWMPADKVKELGAANIKLNIGIDSQKGNDKTKGGIKLNGSGSIRDEVETFSVSGLQASEVLIETDVNIAVKIGDKIKIFKFNKKDNMNRNGTTNNLSLSAKLNDEGHLGNHGNIKTTLDAMKNTTGYSRGDLGGPVFYINIPEGNSAIAEKIKNSTTDQPESVPSASELLNLYTTQGGAEEQTTKFKTMFALP